MGRDWYEACARRFGGYRQLWDWDVEGPDGEVAFTELLRELVPCHGRVLDVGCGDGIYTLHLAALAEQIVGIDYSAEMVAHARRNQQAAAIPNASFLEHNTRSSLPFPDQSFDLVFSRRGPSSHLADSYRILKPGGIVAGIHSGARDVIIPRVTEAGFRLVRNEEFAGLAILPTLEDFALLMSRIPGNPDYTQPEMRGELERLGAQAARPNGRGYGADHWRFIWMGVKD